MADPPSGSFCAACALLVLQKRDTVLAADDPLEDVAASLSSMDIDSTTPGGSSMSPTRVPAGSVLGPHRGKCYHVRGVSVCQFTSAKHCALELWNSLSRAKEYNGSFVTMSTSKGLSKSCWHGSL